MTASLSEGIARVFLLGAGFSIAASDGAPAGNRMPGMRDLSEAVIDNLRNAYMPRATDSILDGRPTDAYNALRDFSSSSSIPA